MIPAASEYPERTVATQRRALAWQLIGVGNMMQNHSQGIEAMVKDKALWLDKKEVDALNKIAATAGAIEKNLFKLARRLGVDQ